MLGFDDVLVTPFTELLQQGGPSLHRGGPHWPDFDLQNDARHCRFGAPVDDPPVAVRETLCLDGRFAWGGPIVSHFGHQIVDFGMRLGATRALWPEAVFLHAEHERSAPSSLDRTPVHFQSMLAWLGIPPERVRLVDRPTRVKELVVVPQAEQLGGPGPSAAHLDWLDEITEHRFGRIVKREVVYVSRAAMRARFAAEDYLELALERSGVRVMRPETLPLPEQLRAYASARHLIFAEGSAQHGTQLLGRALGEVTVLRRRCLAPNNGLFALEPRAQRLRTIDAVRGLIHGVNRFGVAQTWVGLTVLDEAALVEGLESVGVPLRSHWSSREFVARRDADVVRWLRQRKESGIDSGVPKSAESIEKTLRAAGLGHLLNRV